MIDLTMKFTFYDNYTYQRSGKSYTKKQIIDLIKDDKTIEIVDKEGYDITKDFMIEVAFAKTLARPKGDKTWVLLDFLKMHLHDELLNDMIMAGGCENWIKRNRV